MFTVQDLTTGDLVATFQMTITEVKALSGNLFSVKGNDWNDNHSVQLIVAANKEIEVWE
jgi:hypothetical protein